MDWYIVVKTIKGHRYKYRQRTWRDGKRVRTQSQYLGPAGADDSDTRPPLAPTGAKAPHVKAPKPHVFLGEAEYIDSMFDEDAPRELWVQPWSDRYHFGPAKGDPRLFALAQRLGVAGLTQPYGDEDTSGSNYGAWFSPWRNRLQVPDPTRFELEEDFAATLLHELAHATQKRLGRKRVVTRYAYAHEEVVAELTTAIMMRRLGIKQRDAEHRHYIQSYWEATWSPERSRHTAREQASAAADLLYTEWQAVNTTTKHPVE